MILLPIKKLKPGMVSTQSVYNKKGESILTRGAPMTQKDIDRLAELDLPEISVVSADPRVSVAPPPDVVEETTRSDAIRYRGTRPDRADAHRPIHPEERSRKPGKPCAADRHSAARQLHFRAQRKRRGAFRSFGLALQPFRRRPDKFSHGRPAA